MKYALTVSKTNKNSGKIKTRLEKACAHHTGLENVQQLTDISDDISGNTKNVNVVPQLETFQDWEDSEPSGKRYFSNSPCSVLQYHTREASVEIKGRVLKSAWKWLEFTVQLTLRKPLLVLHFKYLPFNFLILCTLCVCGWWGRGKVSVNEYSAQSGQMRASDPLEPATGCQKPNQVPSPIPRNQHALSLSVIWRIPMINYKTQALLMFFLWDSIASHPPTHAVRLSSRSGRPLQSTQEPLGETSYQAPGFRHADVLGTRTPGRALVSYCVLLHLEGPHKSLQQQVFYVPEYNASENGFWKRSLSSIRLHPEWTYLMGQRNVK